MRLKNILKKKDEELESLAWMISALDNVRTGRGINKDKLESIASRYRTRFEIRDWHSIRRDVEGMQDFLIKKSRSAKFFINLFYATRWLVRSIGLFLVVIVLVNLFFIGSLPPIVTTLTDVVLFSGVAMLVIRWWTTEKIRDFYEGTKDKEFLERKERLRTAAQELIYKMSELLRRKKTDPGTYDLSLFFTDYKTIFVRKRPNVLREHFVATVKPAILSSELKDKKEALRAAKIIRTSEE